MAGKSNKSKSKGKSKVSVGASENHVEGLVEDNGAPTAENLDANSSDLNEQDTKEVEAASEMQDCDSTSNLNIDAIDNSVCKNAETGDNADNLESNKFEGHTEGLPNMTSQRAKLKKRPEPESQE
ncbi:hypothetical protein L7F22_010135 [Adiantum nelumboides]|nr:hypothetical protein [Adiantum nelumboides]